MKIRKAHKVSGLHTVYGGSMFDDGPASAHIILLDARTGEAIFPQANGLDVPTGNDNLQTDAEFRTERCGSAILAVTEPATLTEEAL
jgi:hypothetical protein